MTEQQGLLPYTAQSDRAAHCLGGTFSDALVQLVTPQHAIVSGHFDKEQRVCAAGGDLSSTYDRLQLHRPRADVVRRASLLPAPFTFRQGSASRATRVPLADDAVGEPSGRA